MNSAQYKKIAKLKGIDFIKKLLQLEELRFTNKNFLKGSTFEDINTDFGIFPRYPVYPTYFIGDITNPRDKYIFIGINPGYNSNNSLENAYLKRRGLFNGYCHLFSDFHYSKPGLIPYYANIKGFLKRYDGIKEKIDWEWFQKNVIALEFIPYHSSDAAGLRINDLTKYREIYFEILLKIIRHINPKKTIFIVGFPTLKPYLVKPEFKKVIHFEDKYNFSLGKIDGRYEFIGLPFLTRVSGGKDKLVRNLKRIVK